MIVQGIDTSNQSRPLLLDASGNVIVSVSQLTSTGGKFHIDASGRSYPVIFPHEAHLLPGSNQILKYGEANNATNTIYTVTAGKVFYMTSIFCHISNASAVGGAVTVELHNAIPSKQMEWKNAAVAGALNVFSIGFAVPIKVDTGWSVKIVSSVLNQYIRASITGYEI